MGITKLTHTDTVTAIVDEINSLGKKITNLDRVYLEFLGIHDLQAYTDVTKSFYDSDGFAYKLTNDYLDNYISNISIAKATAKAKTQSSRSVDLYVVALDSDLCSADITTCLLVKDSKMYYPFKDQPVFQTMADRVNENPSAYRVEHIPYEKIPALYLYLDVQGRGERISKTVADWFESQKPTLTAIMCRSIELIVDSMRSEENELIRTYGDILYYAYLDTEMFVNEVKKLSAIAKYLNIKEITLKRYKAKAISYVAMALFPLPVAGESRISNPIFGDSLELYSGSLTQGEAARILGDYRLKYSLAYEVQAVKELIDLKVLNVNSFVRKQREFREQADRLLYLRKVKAALEKSIAFREESDSSSLPTGLTILFSDDERFPFRDLFKDGNLPSLEVLVALERSTSMMIDAKAEQFMNYYEKDAPIRVKEVLEQAEKMFRANDDDYTLIKNNGTRELEFQIHQINRIMDRLGEIREDLENQLEK